MIFKLVEDIQKDSQGNSLSTNQITFFKNSKIRDSNGNLLVCYHGSNEQFDIFDVEETWDYFGFHFGTEKAANDRLDTAGGFRDSSNRYVKPYYLNIKNPYTMKDIGYWDATNFMDYLMENPQEISKLGIDKFVYDDLTWDDIKQDYDEGMKAFGGDDFDTSEFDSYCGEFFRNFWYQSKYDGIIYSNNVEDKNSLSFMTFYPNQIKLISNKNPTNSDNINEDLNEGLSIVGYHGSQEDNIKLNRPLYLTDDKELAIEFAKGYNFNYDLTDKDKPTLYTFEIKLNNPLHISTEEEYDDLMDIVNQEWVIPDLTNQGYDGIIYHDKPNYYLVFNPNNCKLIKKETL